VQEEYENSGQNHFSGLRGYEPFPGARRALEMLNVGHFMLPSKVRISFRMYYRLRLMSARSSQFA